jgi:hypothetical protein
MRNQLAALSLVVGALAAPGAALAWVVVRAAPVYYAPRPVVVVAPMPVYVAPPPVYVAPAPVYPPPQAPSILTTNLPVGTNFMTLPQGCNGIPVNGQLYFQCGVNWMKPVQGPSGTYYSVVLPP